MRMYDIIAKKRDGGTLNHEELSFAVNGYVAGDVPDYQMSALLMAIYLRGMTDEETAMLTDVMAHSGDMVDLSAIAGIKADKHSTGGVGDKTTLVIAPIVAACGVKIAKMSGRGLGHTGGTIDKMEAVPGTRTSLTQEEFFRQVNEIGISVIGQSGKIAVADKKQNGIAVLLFNLGKNIDKKIMVLLNMKTRDIAYNKFSVKSEFRPDFIALIRRESKFIRIDTVSDNIVVAALCCFLAVHPYTGII